MKGRDLLILAAIVLVGGFAVADSLRSDGERLEARPTTTGTSSGSVTDTVDDSDLGRAFFPSVSGAPGSVVDVSANLTTLELSGPAAREVLEKGCPLDLHPRAFGPGRAVSTTVGPIPVLLWQLDDSPTYRLLPRSSFADYLARWLIDAMSEYGGPRVA